MSTAANMSGHFWTFHKARMGINVDQLQEQARLGINVDQLPPSEALPGVGNHFVIFHNGLGYYYICTQFARELEKRMFECMKIGCRVTARMGEGCGSPLIDSGAHSHPPDWDYRNKCLVVHEMRQRFSMQEISTAVVLRDALSSLNEDECPPSSSNFECVTVGEPSSPMLSEELPPITIKEELEETPQCTVIKEEIQVMEDETDDQNNADDDRNNIDDQNEHTILDLGENIDPSTDSVAIIDPSESETIIACGEKVNNHDRNQELINSFRINMNPLSTKTKKMLKYKDDTREKAKKYEPAKVLANERARRYKARKTEAQLEKKREQDRKSAKERRKHVKDMTEKEKKAARKVWRNRKRDLRKRQKEREKMLENTPPDSDDDLNVQCQ